MQGVEVDRAPVSRLHHADGDQVELGCPVAERLERALDHAHPAHCLRREGERDALELPFGDQDARTGRREAAEDCRVHVTLQDAELDFECEAPACLPAARR